MGRICLLMPLIFLCFQSNYAQKSWSLEELELSAHQNNIDLQKQKLKINSAKLEVERAERFSNPIFSYQREDLNSGSLGYDEWTASGSIPLNFIWERWSNIEAKEILEEAENLLFEKTKQNTFTQVRENYFALLYLSALSEKLDSLLMEFSELAVSANDRLLEGDISEYELNRILLEVNKTRSIAAEITLNKRNYENELKLLTGLSSDSDFQINKTGINISFQVDVESCIQHALANRKDLKASELLIKSESAALSYNHKKSIPEMSLSAGYKKQSDNLQGSIFQFNIAIPLFDRNQTEIAKTEFGLSYLKTELKFSKEQIKAEVKRNYDQYQMTKDLLEHSDMTTIAEIIETASYSYQQGEITIVEFIDGINAYLDGLKSNTKLKIDLIQSYYKLENSVGVKLSSIEKN